MDGLSVTLGDPQIISIELLDTKNMRVPFVILVLGYYFLNIEEPEIRWG